jgi:hypothetical protein
MYRIKDTSTEFKIKWRNKYYCNYYQYGLLITEFNKKHFIDIVVIY